MISAPARAHSANDVVPDVQNDIRVIKRNGATVDYQPSKIADAIAKAFASLHEDSTTSTQWIKDKSVKLGDKVHRKILESHTKTGRKHIHIEEIQNIVQMVLWMSDETEVGRNYILYRAKRERKRTEKLQVEIKTGQLNRDVSTESELRTLVTSLAGGCEFRKFETMITQVMRGIYEGIKFKEVLELVYMTASAMIMSDPEYTYLASSALHQIIIDEANQKSDSKLTCEKGLFKKGIASGIDNGILDEAKVKLFDLDALSEAIKPERSSQFTYLGLKTLYDRYLLHKDKVRYETPQGLFMRVAMGLAVNEDDPNSRAIEFYDLLSSFDYMASTPTLFNSLTVRPQLSSCYLTTISDDLTGIFAGIAENAQLSKYAGGIGNDWTQVRAMGAHIKGTNGDSQGVVPFLKVANDTAVAVNQGGKRKGAVCAYLETWHMDVEDFLELRKNTGEERRRTHDMNTANWVPDLFMDRVANDEPWTLFSPDETPDLHDMYGQAFKKRYEQYEQQAKDGQIKNFKTIKAVDLWKKMLGMLFETGHPWITFKDPCNIRSPQKHAGVVHSSNLCTEITLNTSATETAVCNLGSVNLVAHMNDDGTINHLKLEKTITTAIRMLDNVIDENYYPDPKARTSNLKHRPIGLGQMGFQDVLYKLGVPYSSEKAVELADHISEAVSYYAIKASCTLADERGAYETFEGSSWSQGKVPLDTLADLKEERGQFISVNTEAQMDWSPIRQLVAKGIRNSNLMAIAPTATISNITGLFQSNEPAYKHIYAKSNLSGEFTYCNPYLVKALNALDLWDEQMIKDINEHDGLISSIERIPDEIRTVYKTAFEMEPQWLVEAASRRQKWIDQGISLNLYMAEPSGTKLDKLYKLAWVRGLKTTYYLRSLGASGSKEDVKDKSETSDAPKVCSILDPECESCQ